MLQLALGRSQLLVGRLRPPQVVVKDLHRDNHHFNFIELTLAPIQTVS